MKSLAIAVLTFGLAASGQAQALDSKTVPEQPTFNLFSHPFCTTTSAYKAHIKISGSGLTEEHLALLQKALKSNEWTLSRAMSLFFTEVGTLAGKEELFQQRLTQILLPAVDQVKDQLKGLEAEFEVVVMKSQMRTCGYGVRALG